MSFFANKVVVISGIARGIGKAIAIEAAKKGATIAGFDIRQAELTELGEELSNIKATHFLEVTDITNAKACELFVQKTIEKFVKIDVLINCAGITHIAPVQETNTEHFERVIQINLMGTIYLTQSCLPYIEKQQGAIVGISSVAGFTPLYYRTAYAASKHGVLGYLTTLHAEMKSKNVHVMTACPSFVATQLQEEQQKYFSNNTNEALTPTFVALEILKGIEKRKKFVFIGKTAYRAYLLNRFFPKLYEKIMIAKTKVD